MPARPRAALFWTLTVIAWAALAPLILPLRVVEPVFDTQYRQAEIGGHAWLARGIGRMDGFRALFLRPDLAAASPVPPRVWDGNTLLARADANPDDIASLGDGRYAWTADGLLFSFPENNPSNTLVRAAYVLRPRAGLYLVFAVCVLGAVMAAWVDRPWRRRGPCASAPDLSLSPPLPPPESAPAATPLEAKSGGNAGRPAAEGEASSLKDEIIPVAGGALALALGAAGLLLSLTAVYGLTVAAGWWCGHAHPARTAASLLPESWKAPAIRCVLWLPRLLWLTALTGWSSSLALEWGRPPADSWPGRLLRRAAGLGRWGWTAPVWGAMAFWAYNGFLFSSSIPLERPTLYYDAELNGVAPICDAMGYWVSQNTQAMFGKWELIASLRPVAAATRTLTGCLSDGSYNALISAQLALIGLALGLAALAVGRWRGGWAGLAFAALSYGWAREYAVTLMTEASGWFWGLLAVAGFAGCFARASRRGLVGAGAALGLGLLARMGAMFVPPALLLWTATANGWRSGREAWRPRLARTGWLALGLVLAFAVSLTLDRLYAAPGDYSRSSGMSTYLYAMTRGVTMFQALANTKSQVADLTPAETDAYYYREAWRRLREEPLTVAGHVGNQAWKAFSLEMRERLLPLPFSGWLGWLTVLALLEGWRRTLASPRDRRQAWFLAWTLLGMAISLPVLIQAVRTLAATLPLLALALAYAFGRPIEPAAPTDASAPAVGARFAAPVGAARAAWWTTAAAAVGLLAAPAYIQRGARRYPLAEAPKDFVLLAGGDLSSTLLVTPDAWRDQPTRVSSIGTGWLARSGELFIGNRRPPPPPYTIFSPAIPDAGDGNIHGYMKILVGPARLSDASVPWWRIRLRGEKPLTRPPELVEIRHETLVSAGPKMHENQWVLWRAEDARPLDEGE